MAENTKSDTTDESPSERSKARQSDQAGPDRFEPGDLIARSTDFLGQPAHVTAGALHGQEDELSLEQANNAVKRYLDGTQAEPQTEEE